jgi:hypothetical protein
MTRPERMMNVPFFHELLHTFAHGHKDYMAVTCRETGVRMFNGSPAARFVHQKNNSDQLLRCLRGESNPDHTRVLGPLLLRSFGYEAFLQYFAEGRPQRDRLWAADLTEPETDCAIFDSFTDNRARTLFAAAGAPLRLEMVDKGVALLRSGSDAGETAGEAQGPNPKRPVGRAIRTLEMILERGDKEAAVKQIDVIREKLEESPDYRYRADVFCRVGEILYKAKLTDPAYEMMKDCQRAAARVGPGFVARARGMCMKVLKGLPTRTLM